MPLPVMTASSRVRWFRGGDVKLVHPRTFRPTSTRSAPPTAPSKPSTDGWGGDSCRGTWGPQARANRNGDGWVGDPLGDPRHRPLCRPSGLSGEHRDLPGRECPGHQGRIHLIDLDSVLGRRHEETAGQGLRGAGQHGSLHSLVITLIPSASQIAGLQLHTKLVDQQDGVMKHLVQSVQRK